VRKWKRKKRRDKQNTVFRNIFLKEKINPKLLVNLPSGK